MPENQNVEWKESWRDEYLQWICGFANAQGGSIFIGVNDYGKVTGIENGRRLLKEIPDKILTTMGIIAEVNLLEENGKEYLEIKVDPVSYPVSCRGEYYLRSGSTKQQLRGAALTEFLITKTGYKWDRVPADGFDMNDLDNESFEIFRRETLKNERMTQADLNMDNAQLLDHLGLLNNGKLKRAAVMLFGRNPERLITGCYVKIGKFGDGADLQYQDELHGSLIHIADKVIELIYLKYLKAAITYEKDIRVETYPFPRDGVREAIYNALIHNNYADSIPIQIRIEEDKMYISNCCDFSAGWTAEKLISMHKSKPYNPDIANGFFRAGYVESWGRGIQKICDSCRQLGIPEPEYEILGNDITVKFTSSIISKRHFNFTNEVLNEVLELKIITILMANEKKGQKEIAEDIGCSYSTVQRAMKNLIKQGVLARTGSRRSGCWEVIKPTNDYNKPEKTDDTEQLISSIDSSNESRINAKNVANDGANVANDGANVANDGANVANDGANVANDGANVANDDANVANDGANGANDGANVANDGANVANDSANGANDGANVANDGANVANTISNNDELSNLILEQISQKPSISTKELSETINAAKRTVQRKLKEMAVTKMIERKGSRKSGYWQINCDQKDNEHDK